MSGGKHERPAYTILPVASQSRGLVNVAVQRQQRLPLFDEAAHRNAADSQELI